MKAINVILARDRLDRERKKKEENKRARIEMDVPHEGTSATFVPLAPNQGAPGPLNTNLPQASVAEHPRHVQLYKAESASRGSPASVVAGTPPEASQSPIGPGQGSIGIGNVSHLHGLNAGSAHPSQAQSAVDGVFNRLAEVGLNGSRNGSMSSHAVLGTPSWPAASAGTYGVGPRRASLVPEGSSQALPPASSTGIRQLGAEISQLVSDLTPQVITSGQGAVPAVPTVPSDAQRSAAPYAGLDMETLFALRAYIYEEKTEVEWDEEALLRRLETTWREGVRSDYDRMVLDIPAFIARERAFLTWIELKRHLADLQRAGTRTYPIITLAPLCGLACLLCAPTQCTNRVQGWGEEGTTAPEIERRIEQHRTLMEATREILRGYQEIPLEAEAPADHDELLRQALVVLAGSKYAVELQWGNVEFVGLMQWLAHALETYEREQEGDTMYYFS